ncbi:acetyltransferase, GNAT family [hydrothermal vent metagenome]|uniref:Acetyltransferase, GNAT family n=1 Tax=hydrothermal vent metagenome TaxID=652676 RepID=A0A3B0TUZ9_9ZZZZ
MSALLQEIFAHWNSERPSDAGHVLKFYIEHPDKIQCFVAEDENGSIIGFQSLKLARKNNSYGVCPDWGIIGTYVAGRYERHGIGKKLFASTREAAQMFGLRKIDATIGKDNESGLGYYDAMGFQTYRTTPNAICKYYKIPD